jgi:hypothetical protein
MRRPALLAVLILFEVSCADDNRSDQPFGDSAAAGESPTGSDDLATSTASAGTTGASQTSTAADTTAAEDDGTGVNFVNDPDVGLGANECDVWGQDCPDGEKCAPWANDGGTSWNSTRCVPVMPDAKQPGDPCTTDGSDVSGNDDCAMGSLCFAVNPETNSGICVPFCEGSAQDPVCADADQQCNISNEGVLILCLDTCDPILQDCHQGDQPQGCYPVNQDFLCWPDFSFDVGSVGDPCAYFNVCDVGLYCADPAVLPDCLGATGCCTEYCDLSDDAAACSAGVECVPWWDKGMAPPGFEHVGGCIVPP